MSFSKEEIEKAKETSNSYIRAIDTFGTIDYKCINNLYTPIKTLLQYIEQLEQENSKQNKIIDETVKYIATLDIDEDICSKIQNKHCDKMSFGECENCIKKYFKEKVKRG